MRPTDRLRRVARALRRDRGRFNCADQDDHTWAERAEAAVALCAEHFDRNDSPEPVQIGDFGAGNERLHGLLKDAMRIGFDYLPYDLHPQLATTQPLDVQRELPEHDFDLVFCLGLLEYLPEENDFIERLATRAGCVVASYFTGHPEPFTRAEREAWGWGSHYSLGELEARFEAAGYARRARTTVDGKRTTLWLWERYSPDSTSRSSA